MDEKDKFEFSGYIDFPSFTCPKCHNHKDIYCGHDSFVRCIHECSSCGAEFQIIKENPSLKGFQIIFDIVFVRFVCKECGCYEVQEASSLCDKCKQEQFKRRRDKINDLKKQIGELEQDCKS